MMNTTNTPENNIFDVLVIGGGINGTGIARDASGRGLRVILCEQNDLASGASSASTKLIHGGLRYLQYGDLKLVWDALQERQRILKISGHLTKTIRFYLPKTPWGKPLWLVRIGIMLYEFWASSTPRKLRKYQDDLDVMLQKLKPKFRRCLTYHDCWTNDARMVVLNALSAKQYGADIRVRHRVDTVKAVAEHWEVMVSDLITGTQSQIIAKTMVNAAGPWVDTIMDDGTNSSAKQRLSLVKGSHLIVPKLCEIDAAYTLPLPDDRVIFVIPYADEYSLIGSTEVKVTSASDNQVSDAEITYLCQNVNRFFKQQLSPTDVLRSYSGVRPLLASEDDNLSSLSRDFAIETTRPNGATLITVLGGKLTAHRLLSEKVVDMLSLQFPNAASAWTADVSLPGSNLLGLTLDSWQDKLEQRYSFLDAKLLRRYLQLYGSRTLLLLDGIKNLAQMGEAIIPGLYPREVTYLQQEEWAITAEDILWRRTNLGLVATNDEVVKLKQYLGEVE